MYIVRHIIIMLVVITSCMVLPRHAWAHITSSDPAESIQGIDSTAIFIDSAQVLGKTSPLRATGLLNKAIELSLRNGNAGNESRAYKELGLLQQRMGQNEVAMINFRKSIAALERNDADNAQGSSSADMLSRLAELYKLTGNYDQALDRINRAINSSSDGNWFRYHALKADILLLQKNNNAALAAMKEMSDVVNGPGGGRQEWFITLGDLYSRAGDNTKAEEFLMRANSINFTKSNPDMAIATNQSLAQMYRSQGNLEKELQVRQSNIQINESRNDRAGVAQENFEIANAYLQSNDVSNAEDYVQRGMEFSPVNVGSIAIQDDMIPVQTRSAELQSGADALRHLAEGYLQQKNYDKAISYYKQYSALQDSAREAQSRELKEAIALSSQIGKDEQRITMLEKEREFTDKSMVLLQQDRALKGEQVFNRNMIIGVLALVMILLVITGAFMLRTTRARRKADKLLALQSLSGQMNPHFIFNALNSVNEYISMNDERAANRYLASFSRLMRQVMDDSRNTFIPLSEEISMLRLYLELEHARFSDKFDYVLEVSEELDNADLTLPPMIIQPYIENAIWHGLRYREGKGKLLVTFSLKGSALQIVVKDDGIGIQRSKELKTQNQKKQTSLGMKNISSRVTLMNDLYNSGIAIEVTDTQPGTAVVIMIPQKQ